MKRIFGLVILAAGWQALALGLRSPMLSAPSAVIAAGWRMTLDGEMARNVGVSLAEIAMGFLLAGCFGLVAAVWIYQNKSVDEILTPMIDTVRNIPALMLMPVIVLLKERVEVVRIRFCEVGDGAHGAEDKTELLHAHRQGEGCGVVDCLCHWHLLVSR